MLPRLFNVTELISTSGVDMTKITANIILLVMTGVWAYLSVAHKELQAVSQNFLYIGALVAGGEAIEFFKNKKP